MYVFDIALSADEAVETQWHLDVPDLGLSLACVGSRRKAIEFAAEEIKNEITRLLIAGEPVPESRDLDRCDKGERVVTIALEADLPEDELFSVEQTMGVLDVTQPRVSHLIRDGKLVALKRGRKNYITKASLESYLKTPRTSGRPSTREYGVEHLKRTPPELP